MSTPFLWVARAEGLSLLLLFGVAMPLKYIGGFAHATKFPGWIHGLLFVAYVCLLLHAAYQNRWSIGRVAMGLVASLMPFGTFAFERMIQQEE